MTTCLSKQLLKTAGICFLIGISCPAVAQPDRASQFLHRSRTLFEADQFKEARQYADSAILVLNGTRQLDSLSAAFLWRYEINQAVKDYKNALQDFKMGSIYYDSIKVIDHKKVAQVLRDSLALEKLLREREGKAAARKLTEQEIQASFEWRSLLIITLAVALLCLMAVIYFWRRAQESRRSLSTAAGEIDDLNAFRDKLFAVISYDLKDSLDSFQNLTESLSRRMDSLSQEETKQFLANLQQDASSLKATISSVVQWVALKSHSMPFHPELFDCKKLVTAVMSKAKARLASRQITGDVFVPENQMVYADQAMLELILENLVSNAIQFTRPGGVITCFSGKKDGLVTLGVKDTGAGISAGNLTRLFNVKEDVHGFGHASQKGAGVGLILCKELVERNGGRIYAESTEGEGSTFYFTLPEKADEK